MPERHTAGTVLHARTKGAVEWQARISDDRGRLEVVGLIRPSTTPTLIEPLTEYELRELLGESPEQSQTPKDCDGGRPTRGPAGLAWASRYAGSAMSEALTKASPVEPPPFRPTTKQLTYLVVLLEAIHTGQVSDRELCKATRISRATSWKWRQDPAFCTWLGEQTELGTSYVYKAAIARHEWLALRGSVKSLDAVTRARLAQSRGVLGLLAGATDGTDAMVDARSYAVNLLIQRPDDVASSRIVTNPNVGADG